MADGDLRGGKDAGGGVSPKRARSLGAAAAADVGGAPATTITAGDSDALQFLLEGLSPSPIKKVKRSSGDLLDATGEDGKVLPELLSDHGGNAVTSTWPKPSTRRQVLTFGASWDNRSDVDFLNRDANPAGADIALPNVGNGSKGVGSGGTTRRHSDPPRGTTTSSMMMSSSSSMTSSSTATTTWSSSSWLRRSTPTGMSVNGGTAAAAVASGPAAHGLPAQRRRPNSTGSISVNGNGGSSSSGSSSYAAFSSSASANAKRHLANLAAISTNGVAAAGGGSARRGDSGRQHQHQHQRQYQGGGGLKANENNPNLVNDMGSGIRPTGSGGGLSEAKMEMMEMDAAALLLPQVDVRDMRLTTTSPAGSVESDFWGEGEGDDVMENDGFDPMEAAHAAVDRLMGSTTSPMSTAGGNTTSHGASGGGDADGDTRLLEDLLLDGLGLRHMEAGPSGGVVAATAGAGDRGASRSSSRRGAAAGAVAAAQSRPAKASGGGGILSNCALDDFPATPATNKNASDTDKPGTKAKGDHGTGAGGRASGGGGGGGTGGRKNRLSPGSASSSASSTPLSVLSSNSSTPRSAGDGSQTSLGSIAAMTLNPSLWKLVERGETCPFPDCAFTVAFFERKEARKAAAAAAAAGGGGGVGAGVLKEEGEEEKDKDKENRSRCRHFHTLCGCRHTRGVLKGRLFQTNQLDKARNHQKKHAHADAAAAAAAASSTAAAAAAAAAAAPSPAAAGGHGMGRLAAETPSPMPSMAMPSSQESAGSSYFWGSQPDEPLSQGQQQQAQQDAVYSSSPPLFAQGRGSSGVGGDGADGRVGGHGGHDRDRDSVAMQDAGPSSTLPTDDREDESGVDSTAGGKSHHPKKAAKARGRGRGAVKSRRGGGDGGGSDTSCSKEKDTSRDGRRTWTDAESDRLREVVEHRSAGDSRKNWQWVAAKVSEVSPRGPGDSEGGTPYPDGGINPNRKTPSQCKMRWERILNPGVKRGLWTKEEDQKLKEVAAAMEYKWSHVAKLMGGRTYKQCRERYTNYLKEGLNVGPWTKEEDQLLLSMHAKVGNKWAEIARYLKDRSENMIKNEYMKLSRDANASQRRRQAHIDNHTQNSLDSSTNPNSLEVVVSGSPTAGEGGDGEAAKAKKRKGKQPLKGTGGPASNSTSPTPLPDGEAEARHSVGGLWGVTPAPIGTVGGSFAAAARSAESFSFLGEPPAVKLEQQYQHQQQQWQQQQLTASVPRLQQHHQHQQQQQLHGPAGFLVPSSAAGTGVFPTTTAASMAIANPAGGGLGVGNIGFPPHAAAEGGSGDGSGAVGPADSPLGGAASGSDIPSFMM